HIYNISYHLHNGSPEIILEYNLSHGFLQTILNVNLWSMASKNETSPIVKYHDNQTTMMSH
ncbi:MAG: hypothetical protein WBE34_18510, partial [Candidatus Nitrosopolaris sp.]